MKTIILILLSLIILSCGYRTENELTEVEKENIKTELQSLLNEIIDNNERGNVEKSIRPYLDSPEFISITNGRISDYKSFLVTNKQYFEALEYQKYFNKTFQFTFLNKENVIVTWGCTARIKMKNVQEMKLDPYTATLIFKNIEGSWMIVYGHGSGEFSPIAND